MWVRIGVLVLHQQNEQRNEKIEISCFGIGVPCGLRFGGVLPNVVAGF